MPVRALVLPEEVDTQEIIAILAGRLEEGALRFDEASGRWLGGKYLGAAPYGRTSDSLDASIRRSHIGLIAQEPKVIPPPDHIWAGWK